MYFYVLIGSIKVLITNILQTYMFFKHIYVLHVLFGSTSININVFFKHIFNDTVVGNFNLYQGAGKRPGQ